MMYAQEATKLTIKNMYEKIETRKQKAEQIVKTQIAQDIVNACNEAQFSIKVHIDMDTDKDTVINLLKEYHYNIKSKGNMITISWF